MQQKRPREPLITSSDNDTERKRKNRNNIVFDTTEENELYDGSMSLCGQIVGAALSGP